MIARIAIVFFIGKALFASTCGVTYNTDFSGYACPTQGDGYETTIYGLSLPSSSYSCNAKSGSGGPDISTTQKSGCSSPGTFPSNKQTAERIMQDGAATIANEMSVRSGKGNGSVPASAYDLSGRIQKINSMVQQAQSGNGNAMTHGLSIKRIDSHSSYEQTVPSILAGVLTLDMDYFNKMGGKATIINSVGEVDIDPEKLRAVQSGGGVISDSWNALSDGVKNAISFVMGKHDETHTGKGFETLDPLAFMDKQMLGFYAYLLMNLNAGFIDIVYLIFALGTMWAFSVYGYKKYMDKVTKTNEFNVNKLNYLMTAAAGFAFFTAPVIVDPVYTDGPISKAIYQDSSGHNTGDYYGYSTLAQHTIRYAAQMGVYFGNLESDYAMKAFYAFMEFKQGMFESPATVGQRLQKETYAIYGRVYKASLESNFVNKVCRPYYGVSGSFNFSSEAAKNMDLAGGNPKALTDAGISGAQRISMQECRDAYVDSATQANSIINEISALDKEIEMFGSYYTGSKGPMVGNNPQDTFKDFLNMLTWTQNTFGWMSSMAPHSAYLFFKFTDVLKVDYNEKDEKNSFKQSVDNQMKANGGDHESLYAEAGNVVESAVGAVSDVTVGNSAWFIVPGFSDIFHFYESMFNRVTQIGQTGKITAVGQALAAPGAWLAKNVAKLATDTMPGVGKVVSKIVDLLSSSNSDSIKANDGTWIALQTTITLASFVLAMVTVSLMISTITIMVVTVFVTFKIIMYFFELVLFFVSSPIVGIYATAISKNPQNYVSNFFKHLGMLIISPIMIVTSSYLVLPLTELFKSLFSALVTLMFYVFDKGEDYLNTDTVNVYDSAKKIISLSAMAGVADIFASVSVIFISYIVIFNFKDWVIKIIGLDGVGEVSSAAASEFKGNAQKYIAPL